MKLLVDAGNTRLKLSWVAVGSTVRADEVAAFDYADLQVAADWVAGLPGVVSMVCGVNVVTAQRRAQVEAALMAGIQAGIKKHAAQTPPTTPPTTPPCIHWLSSQPQAGGVRNDYAQPQQLGADRWAALLGVAAYERQQQHRRQVAAEPQAAPVPVLLASFGTATTLDSLLPAADADQADYVFPGGLILPGVTLMRQSLSSGTAKLPLIQTSGPPQPFPKHTAEAISAGIAAAQAGALWQQWQMLHQYDRNNLPKGCSEQVERQAGAADRDGMQGANRSNGRSHCEDLQRGRPPESADARGAGTCSEHPKLFVTGGAWPIVEAHIRHWFDTSCAPPITYLQAPALDGLASLTMTSVISS